MLVLAGPDEKRLQRSFEFWDEWGFGERHPPPHSHPATPSTKPFAH